MTPGTDPTSLNVPIAFRLGDSIMLSTLPGIGHLHERLRAAAIPHEATDEELVAVSSWAVTNIPYKVIQRLLTCKDEQL